MGREADESSAFESEDSMRREMDEPSEDRQVQMSGEDLLRSARVVVPQGMAKRERRDRRKLASAAYTPPPPPECTCDDPRCSII